MNTSAFTLILVSALLNALWNLGAKKLAGNLGGIWLALMIAGLVFTPLALLSGHRPVFTGEAIFLTSATCVLNAAYFLLLAKSYQLGEISLIYPLSRGIGVVGTALCGALFLGERLSGIGMAGITVIALGSLTVARLGEGEWRAYLYSLGNGLTIAGCAYFAKRAVQILPPDIYNCGLYGGSALLLIPYALYSQRAQIRVAARRLWRECLVIGIGSPLSYLLALYAFQSGPVSYLGPLRESSIVMGALFGRFVLKERVSLRRWIGIALVALGVAALKLA